VSSRAHRLAGVDFDDPNFERRAYDKELAYAESKSAGILLTVALDCIGQRNAIRAFAVHPGLVPHARGTVGTALFRLFAGFAVKPVKDENGKPVKGGKPFFKSVPQGAATAVWCAVSPQLDGMGGVYCEDCDIAAAVPADSKNEKGVRPWAIDPALAQRLMNMCKQYTGVPFPMAGEEFSPSEAEIIHHKEP